jgi:hypothetical protein
MLTRNLWTNVGQCSLLFYFMPIFDPHTSSGLVNGSCGTVEKILFHPTSDPKHDLPAAILIHFPGYTGIPFSFMLMQFIPKTYACY